MDQKSLGHVMATKTKKVILTSNNQQTGEAGRQTGLQTDRDEGIKSQLMSFCCAPQ